LAKAMPPFWVSVMYFGADAATPAPGMKKGVRVDVEGSLRLDKWEQDGTQRSGLSCMSFHCRIAAIGRNRPSRARKSADSKPGAATSARNDDFHNDEIPF
jgi:single-stranded DNA-binding protein